MKQKNNDFLFSLNRYGIKVGLHRTKALLKKCGDPHKKINFIHIAGTNGKGSTASFIANILKYNNLKVGLYTSPHLINFNERIRINGKSIPNKTIDNFIIDHNEDIKKLGSTVFDTTPALMFDYFYKENIDIGIIETGLGGKLDATNVIIPKISVITNIDYDHMELLGNSIESITKEKCGIIKTKTPVVIQHQKNKVKHIIKNEAHKKNSKLVASSKLYPISNIQSSYMNTSFNIKILKLKIPFFGQHQLLNVQTAIATILEFDPSIDNKKIVKGLKSAKWPGRFQKVSNKPKVIYDVGHNEKSIKNTIITIKEKFPNKKINGILTLKKTKELKGIINLIDNNFNQIILLFPPDKNDFYSQNYLKKNLINTTLKISTTKSIKKFFDGLKNESNELWLIFGSHYIAKEVFTYFNFPFEKGKI